MNSTSYRSVAADSSQRSYGASTSMAIDAGRGVGPFTIGMDVGAALVVTSQYDENPQLVVDSSNPFLTDTLLDLQNLGFRLCFDGYSQRLHVIIVNTQPIPSTIGTTQESLHSNVLRRSGLNFSFHNMPLIRSSRCAPDLRHVYHVCGPTIPGHYSGDSTVSANQELKANSPNSSQESSPSMYYYLKYPGLAFRFPIPFEDYEALKSSDEDLLPFSLPVSSNCAPLVDRLFVFPPNSLLTDPRKPPWLSPSPLLPSVASSLSSTEEIPLTCQAVDVPKSLIPKKRYWNVHAILKEGIRFPCGRSIHFGAALQDVYSEVGAPDRVTLKDVDVVGIMSSHADFKTFLEGNDDEISSQNLGFTNSTSRSDGPADYFCNYFSRGFDLLICGSSHRVKKVILHTNFPGHAQFGDYSRCFFSIPLQGNAAIDVDSSWFDIEEYLGPPSPPLLVDYPRQSSGPTVRKFYGYPGRNDTMRLSIFYDRNGDRDL